MVKATQERQPGTYRGIFKGVKPITITVRATGEEMDMWRWLWQEPGDDTTVGEIDCLTAPHTRQRSNGLRLFTGILGRSPTEADDTEDHIGEEHLITWGPNQNGRYTVVAVSRAPQSAPTQPAPVAPGLPPVDQTAPGELPF